SEHVPEQQYGLPPVHEAWLPKEHPLHRPRHAKRQLTALLCVLVFFTAPVISWVFGARPQPLENRPMAEFPSITDGWGFFTGLGPWATDHLPFRQQPIQSVDGVSRFVFQAPARLSGGSRSAVARPGEQPELDENVFPPVIEGKDGWLFLGHDISYRCVPRMDLDRVIAGLRRWRDVVEASGRKFVLVIAPDKSTLYPEYLPDEYAGQ